MRKQYESMTDLEKIVMIFSLQECLEEYCVDAQDVADRTKLKINVVKGVVGSLVKKGLMDAEEDFRAGRKYFDLFPVSPSSHTVSYGNENLESHIIEEIKNWIKENK